MSIKCWRCREELDTSSVERQVYQSLITSLRGRMCEGSAGSDTCASYRHEDCFVLSDLIKELKEIR